MKGTGIIDETNKPMAGLITETVYFHHPAFDGRDVISWRRTVPDNDDGQIIRQNRDMQSLKQGCLIIKIAVFDVDSCRSIRGNRPPRQSLQILSILVRCLTDHEHPRPVVILRLN